MTPRERWLAVLRREKPDRVPMDWWATAEVEGKIMEHLGCSSMDEVFAELHIDRPVTVGPRYVGPPRPKNTSVFGIRWKPVDYAESGGHDAVAKLLRQHEKLQ